MKLPSHRYSPLAIAALFAGLTACAPQATDWQDETTNSGLEELGSEEGTADTWEPQPDPSDEPSDDGSDSLPLGDPDGEEEPGQPLQPTDEGGETGVGGDQPLRDDGDTGAEEPAEYDPDTDDFDPSYPEPGTQSCSVWQDCAPRYGHPNSGYQCLQSSCTCDSDGSFEQECRGQGAYWIAQECYCAFDVSELPSKELTDIRYCWWTWRDRYYVWCEADTWVDTSYYDQDCYYDYYYEYEVCDSVYVQDGYWEAGICHYEPYWEEVCYDGTFYNEW